MCKELFIKGKYFPGVEGATYTNKKGDRLKSSSKVTALHYAFEYLEQNDDETVTLQELHQRIIRSGGLDDNDVYTQVQLKRELEKRYGSTVTITTVRQLPNAVTLSSVKFIIQEAHDRAREMK